MSLSQDRLVLAATVISESAWVFALLGILGVATGRDASPINWFAVVLLLGLSLILARYAPSNHAVTEMFHMLSVIIGIVLIYLIVSTQVKPGEFEILWLVRLLSATEPTDFGFKAISGVVIGTLLWWRGIWLAKVEFPTESLTFSFRIGILVLAVATIVDISHPAHLNTFPMIFIFFAMALGGLSIGHILPETQKSAQTRTWPKVISVVVSGILVVGLVFGLTHRNILSVLSSPGQAALDSLFKGPFWGVVAPIAYVFDVITGGIIAFFDRVFEMEGGDDEVNLAREAQRALEQLQQEEEQATDSLVNVVQIIEWVIVGLFILFIMLLLVKAFRRILKGRPQATMGQRESMREDANPVSDIGRLLLNLVPDVLKRSGSKAFKLPEGHPGVVAVLRVYYELLNVAEEKGYRRRPQQTPEEFKPTLEILFPKNLVRTATETFNRACYGDHPASEGVIAQMQASLKAIKTAVRAIGVRRRRGFRLPRPRG